MLYQYKAKDQKGILRRGTIEAKDPEEIYTVLKEQGLFLLSYWEARSGVSLLDIFSRISLKDLAVFTKQLQVMVQAGMSLVTALRAQGEQTSNKKLSAIAYQLAIDVEGGEKLSDSLAKFPQVFSPLYINTVKAGESSGRLDQVLDSLSKTLEKDYALSSKIKGAMIYPAFVLCILVVVVAIILTYVVPSLTSLFQEAGASLPLATRILINSSNFVRRYWWMVLFSFVGFVVLLRLFGKTKTGSYLLDAFKLKVPIFGSLIRKIYLARFCRTTATLVQAGLPIVEILKTAKLVITNAIYQEALNKVVRGVESGILLSQALKETGRFPAMVCQLIHVGEASGRVDESLNTLADYFEQEASDTSAAMASLIEPFLIIIIGAVVALVVISVIKPIYTLTEIL